jgi:hypothetical protein
MNTNTIPSLINDYFTRQTKKRVVTKDIENYLVKTLTQDRYWQQGGYHTLVETMDAFVQKGIITPVKSSGLNGLQPPLYQKYSISAKNDIPPEEIRQKLLTWYYPQINTAYYLTHYQHYLEDETYLNQLDNFLKYHKNFASWSMITANERSFQIFQDEKWLLSTQGHLFCQRTGLSLTALRCYPTYEPFFYYPVGLPIGTDEINILIVENKDTFFSLKGLFQKGINTWADCTFSLLIYGEGRKIQKSFSFYEELSEYRPYKANFYYFGDLDPEGILIWYDLGKQYEHIIKPFTIFYEALYDRYGKNAPFLKDKKNGQKYSIEAIRSFLSFFEQSYRAGILELLDAKKYLPQEGLNYILLKKLAVLT